MVLSVNVMKCCSCCSGNQEEGMSCIHLQGEILCFSGRSDDKGFWCLSLQLFKLAESVIRSI